MSKTTKNLLLTKPEASDNITPTIFADNFDTIDTAIGGIKTSISKNKSNISKCNNSINTLQKQMGDHNHQGKAIWPYCVELAGGETHGGYIDFHYQGSTDDYTSRIIEENPGTLMIKSLNKSGELRVLTQGQYTGNGGSSARDIDVGGGKSHFVAVWNYLGVAIVTPLGALIGYPSNGAMAFDGNATCTNGVLHLSSTNGVLNADGQTISYQVL